MQAKYILGALLIAPVLPIMYIQGKRIRSAVPKLPEASGTEGFVDVNSDLGIKTLLIGESTISGVGVTTHKEGFAGAFSSQLADLTQSNVQWKVYAQSGFTARDVDHDLIPLITEKESDLIVIGLGGNDAFSLNSPKIWPLKSDKK